MRPGGFLTEVHREEFTLATVSGRWTIYKQERQFECGEAIIEKIIPAGKIFLRNLDGRNVEVEYATDEDFPIYCKRIGVVEGNKIRIAEGYLPASRLISVRPLLPTVEQMYATIIKI